MCFTYFSYVYYIPLAVVSKLKTITIDIDGDKTVYTLQGDQDEKLETTLGAFEDVLATHFDIDPMTNSLDIVEATAFFD